MVQACMPTGGRETNCAGEKDTRAVQVGMAAWALGSCVAGPSACKLLLGQKVRRELG